jgi:long-chain acyl-CoA synthetase
LIVREFTAPTTTTVTADENLTDMVFVNARDYPDALSFRRKVANAWTDVTAKEFAEQVVAVAKGFIAAGIAPGDRIGLMSATSYEWTVIDFAIWCAGAATVPIYETSAASQVDWIGTDSEVVAIVVQSAAHHSIVAGVADGLPSLKNVWQIEGSDAAIDVLTELGSGIEDAVVTERRSGVKSTDLATLIYTSGTTGRPKGVVLTHHNLLSEVRGNAQIFPEIVQPGNSMLLFLPLAHVLARVLNLTCLASRMTLGHVSNIKNLVGDLAEFQPTFVLGVPRVFEKVYNGAKQKAHASGKGKIFDAAEETAIAYSEAVSNGSVPITLKAKHFLFDKLVYSKLKAALGGHCVAAISGGGPLGITLARFFHGLGVSVYEGYGLTETSAAVAVNTRDFFKVGTVGRVVPGSSVRIADDGEIMLKGDVVFPEYWHNEEATKASIRDGWFATGDLGALDDEGFLSITGRKKEILITAGGKNVAPAPLEDRLRANPLISQCLVVGDQRPFIGALITIDEEFFPTWRAQHDKPTTATITDLLTDPDLLKSVQEVVDHANEIVSHAEAIKKFRILSSDFTEETGEMTPSLKLKRAVIATNRTKEIEALYQK